jgi:GNAT superfamily N-acetyltransferase
MDYRIRRATGNDAGILADLIMELAEYERMLDEVVTDPAEIRRHLEGETDSRIEALIAEDGGGTAIGFALFFQNYSTFLSRWGVYLEDLYVQPEHRGHGAGYALLKRVAEIAVERGARRLEWSVLNWNVPAIDFYRKIGAVPMDGWTTMRLTGEALERLGSPT